MCNRFKDCPDGEDEALNCGTSSTTYKLKITQHGYFNAHNLMRRIVAESVIIWRDINIQEQSISYILSGEKLRPNNSVKAG